jgi:hypothetical protein
LSIATAAAAGIEKRAEREVRESKEEAKDSELGSEEIEVGGAMDITGDVVRRSVCFRESL